MHSKKTLVNWAYKMIYDRKFNSWKKDFQDDSYAKEIKKRLEATYYGDKFFKDELLIVHRYLTLREDFKQMYFLVNLIDEPLSFTGRQDVLQIIREKGIKNYSLFANILPNKYEKAIELLLHSDVNKQVKINNIEKYKALITAIQNGLETNEETFIKLFDKLGISPLFIDDFIHYYYQTLASNTDDLVLSLKYDDILSLEKLNIEYKKFLNSNKIEEVELNAEQVNEAIRFVAEIEAFIELKGDYFLLVDYLVNKGYTIKKINSLFTTLNDLWVAYLNEDCKTNIQIDRTNVKVKDREKQISIFKKLIESYRYVNTSSYFANTICSNDANREFLIDLSFRTKYLNSYKPSDAELDFNDRHSKKLDEASRAQVEEYCNQYRKYYCERKEEETRDERDAKKKEEQKIACDYIRELIKNNPYNLTEYVEKSGKDLSAYRKYLDIVKECDRKLYSKYLAFHKNNIKLDGKKLDSEVDTILYFIMKGVEEEGATRPFDIVDYYETTNMPLETMRKCLGRLDSRSLVASFFNKYKSDRPLGEVSLESVLKKDVSYKIPDKNGNIIAEYHATEEDKQEVVAYLREKNIPITSHTYQVLLKRIVLGKNKKAKQKEIKPNA